jgi:rhodanese-related sulfurtransferase
VIRLALSLTLALSSLACSGGASGASTGGGASAAAALGGRVSGAEAHALVGLGATLLDVRSPEEFASGHVEGAVLLPVDELEGRLSEVSRTAPVVVYCRSGGRSARAAQILSAAGYEVHDLGGMSNWDE